MNCRRTITSFLLVCLAAVVGEGCPAYGQAFVPIGDLSGGGFASKAFGVSEDGRWVVGDGRSDLGVQAFRYDVSTGVLTGLGGNEDSLAFESHARAVTSDGVAVGWHSDDSEDLLLFGAIWDLAGGLTSIASNCWGSGVFDATPDGSLLVGWDCELALLGRELPRLGDVVAGTFEPGVDLRMQNASVAGGVSAGSGILGVSHAGDAYAVTRMNYGVLIQAVHWSAAEGRTDLGTLWDGLPGAPGEFGLKAAALGISPDGTVVVGWSVSPQGPQAFQWDAVNGMDGLGDLGSDGLFDSVAYAVSDEGQVVGTADDDGVSRAFVYDGVHGMRALEDVLDARGIDFTGYELAAAHDISADGRFIVGEARNLSRRGKSEAFLVSLPEPHAPPAALAAALALRVLVSRRARPTSRSRRPPPRGSPGAPARR